MSRIRSVHPGLFTDEDFVGLSDAAQIFFVGIWTEADDFGAFEWKPVTLKIKLRGASTLPVEPLLAELSAAGRIRQYEHGGRQYGVIRNFCRYQRPKFPKSSYFIPEDLRTFTGSTAPPTEIDRVETAPLPRKEEKPPLMEDVGGNRSSEPNGSAAQAPPPDPVKAVFDRALVIYRGAGMTEDRARKLIGKQRSDFGNAKMLTAITRCEAEIPTDPVSFIAACLGQMERGRTFERPSFGSPGFA